MIMLADEIEGVADALVALLVITVPRYLATQLTTASTPLPK